MKRDDGRYSKFVSGSTTTSIHYRGDNKFSVLNVDNMVKITDKETIYFVNLSVARGIEQVFGFK